MSLETKSFKTKSFKSEHDETTGVVTLTLDRPDKYNALTFEVYDELRHTFRALGHAPGVRAIVITGSGRAFCTGGDVNDIIGPLLEYDAKGLHDFTAMTCDLVKAMRQCPRPIVAGLNGTVAGAGAVIAIASDLRVAAVSAKIAFLFTKVGLSGADMGSCWILPRLVGYGRATEWLMTGDFIDAREAHRTGLYNRLVPDGEALVAARELAEKLARGPAPSIAVTKEYLEREANMEFIAALDAEARVQADLMLEDDFHEGYRAFVEKRPAKFS